MGLENKVVLITGAARGIGAETARRAVAKGARVALVGLEPERLRSLSDELGERAAWFEADVTDQAQVDGAVAGTVAAFGGIDVVLANAGVGNSGTVAITPVEVLLRTIEINLDGVVRTVSAALPHVTQRGGYVMIVSSTEVVAFSGQGNFSNASSKLLRSLRWSRTRSVSIQPGCTDPTLTPLWATSSRRQLANCSTAALEAA